MSGRDHEHRDGYGGRGCGYDHAHVRDYGNDHDARDHPSPACRID